MSSYITFKDYLHFFKLFILNLIYVVLGVLILPIAVLFREQTTNKNKESNQEKFKWEWVDNIWGNEYDGFGDIYYRRDFPLDTYWSRLNWCMLRNPTHNFAIRNGVDNKRIIKSDIYGNPNVTDDPFEKNTGWKVQVVQDNAGKVYKMLYICKLWRQIIPYYKGDRGIRILLGYKNFCVKEVPETYQYGFTTVITPFKMFVKG